MDTKADSRNHFRSARRRFVNADSSRMVCEHLLEHLNRFLAVSSNRNVTIAAYLSSEEEVSIDPALTTLREQNHTIAVPRIGADNNMRFHRFSPEEVAIGAYGLRTPNASCPLIDPTSLDVFLMPLVAFDTVGNRLGMGGGYYDRYLSQGCVARQAPKIGIAFNCQKADTLPTEHHDIRLDAVVTETGWKHFG